MHPYQVIIHGIGIRTLLLRTMQELRFTQNWNKENISNGSNCFGHIPEFHIRVKAYILQVTIICCLATKIYSSSYQY